MTYQVEHVSWTTAKQRLTQLREKVFIFEWKLPRDAEFDGYDLTAHHIIINDSEGTPVATGRLTQDGELGRIAVRRKYRTLPLYRLMFETLIQIAKDNDIKHLHVRCDLSSVDYHRKLWFKPHGPAFMEAGIPRQRMACQTQHFTLPDVTQMH